MTWLSSEDSRAVRQAKAYKETSNEVADIRLSTKSKLDQPSFHRELAIAREVQRASLPAQTPRIPGLSSAIFYKPAHSVGGDYYDFLFLRKGTWAIAVGDVSGKNISAALVMANLQGLLRAQASHLQSDPATQVANINRLVWEFSPQQFFASLFYAEYQPQSRMLRYVNAGHNPPIVIRRAHGRCVLHRLPPECAPVGALKDSRYASTGFQLQVDDVLVAYTDGVTESQDNEGNGFGQERLERILLDCRSGGPNKVLQLILDELSAYSAGCSQT